MCGWVISESKCSKSSTCRTDANANVFFCSLLKTNNHNTNACEVQRKQREFPCCRMTFAHFTQSMLSVSLPILSFSEKRANWDFMEMLFSWRRHADGLSERPEPGKSPIANKMTAKSKTNVACAAAGWTCRGCDLQNIAQFFTPSSFSESCSWLVWDVFSDIFYWILRFFLLLFLLMYAIFYFFSCGQALPPHLVRHCVPPPSPHYSCVRASSLNQGSWNNWWSHRHGWWSHRHGQRSGRFVFRN